MRREERIRSWKDTGVWRVECACEEYLEIKRKEKGGCYDTNWEREQARGDVRGGIVKYKVQQSITKKGIKL